MNEMKQLEIDDKLAELNVNHDNAIKWFTDSLNRSFIITDKKLLELNVVLATGLDTTWLIRENGEEKFINLTTLDIQNLFIEIKDFRTALDIAHYTKGATLKAMINLPDSEINQIINFDVTL